MDSWIDGYDSGTGFTGGGGRFGFTRPTNNPKGGLTDDKKWNAATEKTALFHYDKDYIAYTNVPPAKDPNDPISQILGETGEEEPFRYAPRVPGNAFSPAAVSEYAAMSQERDRNILPKINLADSWDRGIQTLPTPPAPPAPTSPTPTSTTPTPPKPTPPTPPKPSAGPVKL